MNIRGTTHLKKILCYTYDYTSYRSRLMPAHHALPNIFGHSLCSTIISGMPVIPRVWQFRQYHTETVTNKSSIEDVARKLVFPIIPCNNSSLVQKRTADPILGYLLGEIPCDSVSTVKGVKAPSGDIYYGSGGFLLDQNLTPLLILGIEYEYINEGSTTWGRSPVCPVCVINPVVFSRDDLMSKYIVKKVIPAISDYSAAAELWNPLGLKDKRMKTIITQEISNFVESTVEPKGDINEDLWKVAEENINEILEFYGG